MDSMKDQTLSTFFCTTDSFVFFYREFHLLFDSKQQNNFENQVGARLLEIRSGLKVL